MKSDAVEMCLLYDYYGNALTDKQKEIFELYYNEDLSLAEISMNLSISRQGARDSIIRSEEILRDYENRLGFVSRFYKINAALAIIAKAAEQIGAANKKLLFSTVIEDNVNLINRQLSAITAASEE